MAFLQNWDEIEAEINGQLNEVVGEEFTLIPVRSRPNKRAVVDTLRGAVVLCGIFTRQYVNENVNSTNLSSKGLKFTNVASRSPILEIRACDVPYEVLQGDFLIRKANGVSYQVTNPQANGHGIITVQLVEEKLSVNSP